MKVTEEMEDAGAEAYHDAKRRYALAYAARHAHRWPGRSLEDIAQDAPITPSVWLRPVFEAMLAASERGEGEAE